MRCAIESFLPELKGRRVLLHADNQSVVGVLSHLTSRSPVMMSELRKMFLNTDENDIRIRTQYIRSAANIWADKLSRETDTSDWQRKKERKMVITPVKNAQRVACTRGCANGPAMWGNIAP